MIETRQTLILGLGQSGKKTLEHFKKRMLQTYNQELPAFKLLALDVSQPGGVVTGGSAASSEQTTLGPTEYLDLPLEDILRNPQAIKEKYPWFPERVLESGPEWYQTRAASRLAFQLNLAMVYSFLEYHFSQLGTMDARDEMAKAGFDIATDQNEAALVVVGSLGDPVGSGILIDITYLIQYLISRKYGMELRSTALLYMPPLAPSSPSAEACAYASLKELSAQWDQSHYHLDNAGLRYDFNTPPFNRGCYLVDTQNEKALRLRNQEEGYVLGAEWLFRTLLTNLGQRIGGWISEQPPEMRVQGQSAFYASLGLATYVMPTEDLVEWSANRLGNELSMECLLQGEGFQRANARVNDFLNTYQLRPENLLDGQLRQSKEKTQIPSTHNQINALQRVSYDRIVGQVRHVWELLRSDIIPGIRRQAEENARRVLREIDISIREEVRVGLKDNPLGGLSLIRQTVQRLKEEADRFSQAAKRRQAAAQGAVTQNINKLNRLGPELQNAVSGIPSPGVLAVTLVAGIIAPLLLISLWVYRGFEVAQGGMGGVIVAVAVWLLSFLAIAYSIYDAINDVNQVRAQYITCLNDYYLAEMRLTLAQTATTLYLDIKTVADGQLKRLDGMLNNIQSLARTFRSRLGKDPMCGQVGFALQNSVLTPELIDQLYDETLGEGGVNARLASLIDSAGSLDLWLERDPGELEGRILEYTRQVFKDMKTLRAVDLLNKQILALPGIQRDRFANDLLNKAAPLCSYDAFRTGANPALADQTFAGMPFVEGENEIGDKLTALRPSILFEILDDSRAVAITILRRGMPLFGLRRMDTFRGHYLEGVRDEGKAYHISDEMAITPDLIPYDQNVVKIEPATVFAVGRTLGLIQPREDGVYCFTDPKTAKIIPLSHYKTDAVILLGAEPVWMTSLIEQLEVQASQGVQDLIQTLTAKLTSEISEPWEQVRVQNYLRLLSL